jgi:hypothetical protein
MVRILSFALALSGCVSVSACAARPAPLAPASPPAPSAQGAVAWERLKARLPGTWTTPSRRGGTFTVSFKLISGGSVLVEHWGAGTEHETETLIHPDHDALMLTHYCAQGNQPRLRASEVTADAVLFRWFDATNHTADQAMLVEQTLRFLEDGSLEDVEVYRASDGTEERTVNHFTRAGS